MTAKTYQDRELAILLDWLDRYPAAVSPPTSDDPQWRVEGGKYAGSGTNPLAALRDYRKAMMSSRRRPKTDGAT